MTAPIIVGYMELPDHFLASTEQRRAVKQLVNARFPFEVDVTFQMDRQPFQAVFTKTQQCPTVVPFVEWRKEVEACRKGEVFIGLDKRRTPYKASFLTDDPHWGFEVGSRRGKSTFLSFTIAQILHQDPLAAATGIDVKRESFKALFGVPRFTLSNDPRNILDMWAKIRAFREQMDQRCDARAKDPGLDFPFNILAIDESSQFYDQSAALWRRVKKSGDPAHAPVWDDVAAVMYQGAAFHCHVVLAGQRVDDQKTGGFGLIGSMGFRGLAGFRKQNWDRLIGTTPVPRSHPGRGRWIYSDGGSETWVQNMLASDAEIKDWAMTLAPGASVGPEKAAEPVKAGVEWVSGLDAAADYLGLTKDAFVQRRKRAGGRLPGESRRGNVPVWRAADLDSLMEKVA